MCCGAAVEKTKIKDKGEGRKIRGFRLEVKGKGQKDKGLSILVFQNSNYPALRGKTTKGCFDDNRYMPKSVASKVTTCVIEKSSAIDTNVASA